jgi:hypothetical protein
MIIMPESYRNQQSDSETIDCVYGNKNDILHLEEKADLLQAQTVIRKYLRKLGWTAGDLKKEKYDRQIPWIIGKGEEWPDIELGDVS